MDMFVINGGRRLQGRVTVSGAKNAALPIMASALMADGPTRLHNVPDLMDIATMSHLLRRLGLRVFRKVGGPGKGSMVLQVEDDAPCLADYELVRRMRAGVCVLGPLLARRGRACVSLPGGCNIGDRPIDLHIRGLRALGADIRIERGYVIAEAAQLRGCHVSLRGPQGSTVTGTCNVMAAATLAEGTTVIDAAACEPEVVDLGKCLNGMGARITGLGTRRLHIEGVPRLTGTQHTIIPDRIEAATLIAAAAITGGDVNVENLRYNHLTAVLNCLQQMGVRFEWNTIPERREPTADSDNLIPHPSSLRVTAPQRLAAVDVVAQPYPGTPTDVQAQLTALLATAKGIGTVTDGVFPDRFMHVAELCRMGADIRCDGPTAVVSGRERLSGACVMASDLRASAALVLAALAATGPSVVRRIYHLDRGYESLEAKLNALGADVHRVQDVPANMPSEFAALQPPASRKDTLARPA